MEQNQFLILILHLWVLFIYSVSTHELINQAPFPLNGEKQEFVGLDSAVVFWMKHVLQMTFFLP